jgi:hypothetical protein
MKEQLRRDDERLMHLFLLGNPSADVLKQIHDTIETAARGTQVVVRPATSTPQEALPAAQELKTLLLQAAEKP